MFACNITFNLFLYEVNLKFTIYLEKCKITFQFGGSEKMISCFNNDLNRATGLVENAITQSSSIQALKSSFGETLICFQLIVLPTSMNYRYCDSDSNN